VCARYEVNPKYVPDFEAAGLKFVGRDVDNERMEVRARIFKPKTSIPCENQFRHRIDSREGWK
jgi:CTP synthase (UTP-ammonia lyase)